MKFRCPALFGLACTFALAATTGLAADKPSYSNKWRIEVSESAKSDGTLAFRLTPKDGAPVEVNVAIPKGRGENQIAQDISKTFQTTVDKETYKVEVDDGEDVLVKKRKGPDFALELVNANVESVRIRIEKE